MKYISAKQAAEAWGIGERRVQYFCINDRIPGARRVGNQWIIPDDAPRPADGRTREARTEQVVRHYRFPILIFTAACNADDLNREERALLHAQTLYLEGNYAQSAVKARALAEAGKDPVLRFGALVTQGYDAMLLGLPSEFQNAARQAEELLKAENEHTEDLKLILAGLRYHVTWDFTPVRMVNPARLSPEVFPYFHYLLLIYASMSGVRESDSAMMTYELLCLEAERSGIVPLVASLHFETAALYSILGNGKQRDAHIERGCSIALERGFYNPIAKHFMVFDAAMEEVLGKMNRKAAETIRELATRTVAVWSQFTKSMHGTEYISDYVLGNNELIHLVINDLSVREIAEVLGITQNEVNNRLRRICAALHLNGKKELAAYMRLKLGI